MFEQCLAGCTAVWARACVALSGSCGSGREKMWRVWFEDKRQNQAEIKNSTSICSDNFPMLRSKHNRNAALKWIRIQTHTNPKQQSVLTVVFTTKWKWSQLLATFTPFSSGWYFLMTLYVRLSSHRKILPAEWKNIKDIFWPIHFTVALWICKRIY